MTARRFIPALWSGVVILALIGVVASVARGVSVAQRSQRESAGIALSRIDSLNILHTAKLLHLDQGSPEFVDGLAQVRRMMRKFYSYPTTTLLHVVPGALFMLLAPFQFVRRIRDRHINVHRWSGRILVASILPVALSGLFFGLFMPFSGLPEALALALFGGFLLFALARAIVAIRRKDVEHHREWMLRMFAVAMGVSMQRIVAIGFVVTTREGPVAWFAQSVWLGFIVTLGVAELWIRATRSRPVSAADAVLPSSRFPASTAPRA